MTGTVPLRAAGRLAQHRIRHVSPVHIGDASDQTVEVYAQVERDFGMLAPPITLHSPAPDVLAAAWSMLRESLLAGGPAGRANREAVAAAVSAANTCPYCVEVHSATLARLRGGLDSAGAVEAWAQKTVTRDGSAGLVMPFPVEQVSQLVGVAVTFQYLNRMVNVFLDGTPLPPRLPAGAHKLALGVLGRLMARVTRETPRPGDSHHLLTSGPLPADLDWAAGNPAVAGAFSGAATAIEAAGHRSVPAPVRDLVVDVIAGWAGERPGLSRAWTTEATSALPSEDQAAGRLALLVALASDQVDQAAIDAFREHCPADRTLVEFTSWVSLTAARRVGTWIWTGRRTAP